MSEGPDFPAAEFDNLFGLDPEGGSTDRPSGKVLPLILRGDIDEGNTDVADVGAAVSGSVSVSSSMPVAAAVTDGKNLDLSGPGSCRNHARTFDAAQLYSLLEKAALTMRDVQRQLYRGEELYFQETDGHGNVYRGWDAFVDSRDFGGGDGRGGGDGGASSNTMGGDGGGRGSGHGGSISSTSGPSRRMRGDDRWFSSSCPAYPVPVDGRGRPVVAAKRQQMAAAVGARPASPVPAPTSSLSPFTLLPTPPGPKRSIHVTVTGNITTPGGAPHAAPGGATSAGAAQTGTRIVGQASIPASVISSPDGGGDDDKKDDDGEGNGNDDETLKDAAGSPISDPEANEEEDVDVDVDVDVDADSDADADADAAPAEGSRTSSRKKSARKRKAAA